MFLTVFTPTYNRAHLLPRLYESLHRQTCKDFEWIIVDDGSTDNTEEVVNGFIEKETTFPIRYIKQANGGKHRAFNRGVKEASGTWFKCMDSDDMISERGIEQIKPYCDELENNSRFCSVTALRVYNDNTTIGTACDYEVLDSDFFFYRHKLHIQGDRAECIKTSVWREFPFPEFHGEKFLAEGCVLIAMARKYKTRYVNIPFTICEYQKAGLTDRFNQLCEENPLGMLFNLKEIITFPSCPLRTKITTATAYYGILGRTRKQRQVPPECLLNDGDCIAPLYVLAYKASRYIKRIFKNNYGLLRFD